MVDSVRNELTRRCELLGAGLPSVPSEIPHIHFAEAMELITQATGEDVTGEPDLAPAHERWLCEWSRARARQRPPLRHRLPAGEQAVLYLPRPGGARSSNGFDLLFRGMEIVTGGQRLHRHEDYLAALAARGERPEAYAGYLQVFEHGMPPHGGFALGLERWAARLTGAANVRQLSMFPRDLHRLSP